MKSIFTLASVALMQLSSFAQPVITAANVSPNFDAEFYYSEIPAGFSVGGAGANQTWNFSSIGDGVLLGTQTAIDVSSSPFASEFPQANYCYNMISEFSPEVMYFYHSLTPSIFEIYSLGFNGEVGEDFRPNPRTYVTFPYTFGTVFTDTFERTEDAAPKTQTVTYDAYGTLIMPFGTFNNVVRQKVVIDGVTDYAWFNVNPFYPIMQTSLADGILGYIRDNTILGIGDNQRVEKLVTYPNPAAGEINIKMPEGLSGEVSISIADMTGKTVLVSQIDSVLEDHTIGLSSLQSGVYLITMTTGSGEKYCGRIIKK